MPQLRSIIIVIMAVTLALVGLAACETLSPSAPYKPPTAKPKAGPPKHGADWYMALAAQRAGNCPKAVQHWDAEILREMTKGRFDLRSVALARANRARCYQILGRHVEAISDYTLALKSNRLSKSMSARIYNNRGVSRLRRGELSLALADYNESIRLYPDKNQAYYNRAKLYYLLGRRMEALSDIRVYVYEYPSEPNGQKLLRELLRQSQP